jgi:Flp pilus assembly protein TadD
MKKRFFWAVLAAAAASILAQGCASRPAGDEIKFGVWASQQNLWDEAIFRWKKALESNPNSAAAHNNLAVAYERKGMFDEALKEYELALKLDPKNESIKSNSDHCKENLQPAKPAAEAKKSDAKK